MMRGRNSKHRGTNAPGPIARDAQAQRAPFSFSPPKVLRPGQEYRRIRVRGTEDADDARKRAREMPWWRWVTSPNPVRASSDWWLWTVRMPRGAATCR